MSEKVIENNKVSVIGEIISGFTFSHEVFGEGFYMVDVAVNRLSENAEYYSADDIRAPAECAGGLPGLYRGGNRTVSFL